MGSPVAPFEGVAAALLTFFDDSGELDVASTRDHALRLVDSGIRAVVVAGTTGEAECLTAEERVRLVEAVRASVPDTPVVVGTGASWGGAASRFTRDAVAAGADAVLVMTPRNVTDVRSYYQQVRDAAAPVPVLGYHFPRVSSPGIPLADLPNLPVVGLKDSSGDAGRLSWETSHYRGAVYTGSFPLTLLAGVLGASGAILALANLDPAACIAAFGGDREAQTKLVGAHLDVEQQGPRGLKYLVAHEFATPVYSRVG